MKRLPVYVRAHIDTIKNFERLGNTVNLELNSFLDFVLSIMKHNPKLFGQLMEEFQSSLVAPIYETEEKKLRTIRITNSSIDYLQTLVTKYQLNQTMAIRLIFILVNSKPEILGEELRKMYVQYSAGVKTLKK